MDTNELKQKIEGLLKECPDRKKIAARVAASDAYSCYSWFAYRDVVKDYCDTQVEFYKLVAEGNHEKIAAFINSEVEILINSFISNIEELIPS